MAPPPRSMVTALVSDDCTPNSRPAVTPKAMARDGPVRRYANQASPIATGTTTRPATNHRSGDASTLVELGSPASRNSATPPTRKAAAVQTAVGEVELRIVCDPLGDEAEARLREEVASWLEDGPRVTLRYVDGFPSGKFEEFVSEVAGGREDRV